MLASRLWLCAASCPGRVLTRNPFGRLLHLLPCATFFAAKVSVSQAPSPNAVLRRHASPGTRKAISPIIDRKPPFAGTVPKSSLPNRALSESGFAHDTPATLCMKRQTTYIFVIVISSLRLNSELWQKSLLRSRFGPGADGRNASQAARCLVAMAVLDGTEDSVRSCRRRIWWRALGNFFGSIDDGLQIFPAAIPERPHACCLAFQ
jgi:hypothetical protein